MARLCVCLCLCLSVFWACVILCVECGGRTVCVCVGVGVMCVLGVCEVLNVVVEPWCVWG